METVKIPGISMVYLLFLKVGITTSQYASFTINGTRVVISSGQTGALSSGWYCRQRLGNDFRTFEPSTNEEVRSLIDELDHLGVVENVWIKSTMVDSIDELDAFSWKDEKVELSMWFRYLKFSAVYRIVPSVDPRRHCTVLKRKYSTWWSITRKHMVRTSDCRRLHRVLCVDGQAAQNTNTTDSGSSASDENDELSTATRSIPQETSAPSPARSRGENTQPRLTREQTTTEVTRDEMSREEQTSEGTAASENTSHEPTTVEQSTSFIDELITSSALIDAIETSIKEPVMTEDMTPIITHSPVEYTDVFMTEEMLQQPLPITTREQTSSIIEVMTSQRSTVIEDMASQEPTTPEHPLPYFRDELITSFTLIDTIETSSMIHVMTEGMPSQSSSVTEERTSQEQSTTTQKTTEKQDTPTTTSLKETSSKQNREKAPRVYKTVPVHVCPCACPKTSTIPKNVSTEFVQELTNNLQRNLTVSTDSLSNAVRKKTSAQDTRQSSQITGILGIVLLTLTFGALIGLDLMGFIHFVWNYLKR